MAKKKKIFYAVISPEFTGIVKTNKEFNDYILGKKNAKGKKLKSEDEANAWIRKNEPEAVKGIYAIYGPDFTGIVDNEKEFRALVFKKKGMKGKRCKSEEEAQQWMKLFIPKAVPEPAEEPPVQVLPERKRKEQVIMYIDGGYKEPTGTYGIVAYSPKSIEPIYRTFGYVYDERLNSMKNTGAELMACIRALEWAYANDYEQICIIYDYEGIVDHSDKTPSKEGTALYYKTIQQFKQLMDIQFLHVRHGNKVLHNEAHKLTQRTIWKDI